MTDIVTKEKFLELKEQQKDIIRSNKLNRKDHKNYINERRKYYHSKGMKIPGNNYYDDDGNYIDVDKQNGFKYEFSNNYKTYSIQESRYFNIIYGLIRGRAYLQIESKVKKGNELSQFYMKMKCDQYKIDYDKIRVLIWGK